MIFTNFTHNNDLKYEDWKTVVRNNGAHVEHLFYYFWDKFGETNSCLASINFIDCENQQLTFLSHPVSYKLLVEAISELYTPFSKKRAF